MTIDEHLLTCLMEECAEVTKNVSKCLRFGFHDRSPYKTSPPTNAETVAHELTDLLAVARMLVERGVIPPFERMDGILLKQARVREFMQYSSDRGRLEP